MFEFIMKFFAKKTEPVASTNTDSQEKYWFDVYDYRWPKVRTGRIIARNHDEAATKYVESFFGNTYEQIHEIVKREKWEPYKKL